MTCLTSFGNALIRPLRVLENVGLLRVLQKQKSRVYYTKLAKWRIFKYFL